ncbi:GntR family transcriptional regulator [uncultured Friedmanniella sp.]|uniref:GntR family transcriptional regulator n=1 Tax=uncultured Friedmanniella sp. TaxID=335381 RepID=UPI0035CAE50A
MTSVNDSVAYGTSLGGLARTNLREQALRAMRNAVTSGQIAPGTHLVETELSAALSISRGTLREALRQLQQEGLVEAAERGRLRVRSLSPTEITDLFEVRSALEGLAAASLARIPDRDGVVAELQAALEALAAATGSISDMVEIDLAFHRALCRLTGNSALLHSWEGIAGSIRMSIMFAGTERATANMSVPRHQVLVDAIASGDPGAARAAVEEHMAGAATTLVAEKALENGQPAA